MGTPQLYADNQKLQDIEICHLGVKIWQYSALYSPKGKFICFPAEVNMHRKINLGHIPQSLETQEALIKLCEEK